MKILTTILIVTLLTTPLTFAAQSEILQPQGQIQDTINEQLQEDRWELVMFWATYCRICKEDFEKLAAFIEENSSIPLTIVGVVVDGFEEHEKAVSLINNRNLHYTHLLTDYDAANDFFKQTTDSKLNGVPAYVLYNTRNEMVGFIRAAIDLDALEIHIYE